MSERPILHIYRGCPGSGKTTKAKQLGVFHVEADQYFMQNSEYKWYPTGKNHEWCQYMVERAMMSGVDVAVSNTFTRLKEFKHYLDLAVKYDYKVMVVRCIGNFPNTHSVPEDTLIAMRNRFEDFEGEEIYDPHKSHIPSL